MRRPGAPYARRGRRHRGRRGPRRRDQRRARQLTGTAQRGPAEPELLATGPEPAARRRLPRRYLLAAAVAAAALAGAGAVGYALGRHAGADARLGLPETPRPEIALVADQAFSDVQDPPHHEVTLEVLVANVGRRDVTLTGMGADATGLALRTVGYRVGDRAPAFFSAPDWSLPVGHEVGLVFTYRVVDCAAARHGHLALPVHLRAGALSLTVNVARGSSYAGSWQAYALSGVCPTR